MRIQCPCCLKSFRLSDSSNVRDFTCERCGNVIVFSASPTKRTNRETLKSKSLAKVWVTSCTLLVVFLLCVALSVRALMLHQGKTVERDQTVSSAKTALVGSEEKTNAQQMAERDETGESITTAGSYESEIDVASALDPDTRRQRLVRTLEKSVLLLKVDCEDHRSLGSGFLAELNGRQVLLTNFHVVHGGTRISAEFHDGKLGNVRGFYLALPEIDLCVLDVQVPAGHRPSLPLLATEPVKASEVLALGAPKGLGFSVTLGIVSAIRGRSELGQKAFDVTQNLSSAQFGYAEDARWVQTSAPISSGNSGGPLVDVNGVVVGMNTFTFRGTDAENLNFALSSASILERTRDLADTVHALDDLPRLAVE